MSTAVDTKPRMEKRNGATFVDSVTADLSRLLNNGEATLLLGLVNGPNEQAILARQVTYALATRRARSAKSICFVGAKETSVIAAFEAEQLDPALLDFVAPCSDPTAAEMVEVIGTPDVCVMILDHQHNDGILACLQTARILADGGTAVLVLLTLCGCDVGISHSLTLRVKPNSFAGVFDRIWAVLDNKAGQGFYAHSTDNLAPVKDPNTESGYQIQRQGERVAFQLGYRVRSAVKFLSIPFPHFILNNE